MRQKRSIGHRLFDAPQAVLYGAATVATGATTVVLGTATLATAATGIGLIVAVPLAGLTYASVGAATYFGSKTIHKASHVAGGKDDCHSLGHAKSVMTAARHLKKW